MSLVGTDADYAIDQHSSFSSWKPSCAVGAPAPAARPGRGYPQKEGGLRGKVRIYRSKNRARVYRREDSLDACHVWHSNVPRMARVGGDTHMPVTRLRTRRDARERDSLETLRAVLVDQVGMGAPLDLVGPMVARVERRLAASKGWSFVMVEPHLFHDLVLRLTADGASARPAVAVRVLTSLFRWLPPDGNEVAASRSDIAADARCRPEEVSRAMRELEAVGAVYRRREGRHVRFYVNPKLGTHLTGTARDQAQAEAPRLRLVGPAEEYRPPNPKTSPQGRRSARARRSSSVGGRASAAVSRLASRSRSAFSSATCSRRRSRSSSRRSRSSSSSRRAT